jgi:hypothetical protein
MAIEKRAGICYNSRIAFAGMLIPTGRQAGNGCAETQDLREFMGTFDEIWQLENIGI